jgi:hypothetical protein
MATQGVEDFLYDFTVGPGRPRHREVGASGPGLLDPPLEETVDRLDRHNEPVCLMLGC